ncbi:hypothetical protein MLD38_027875 [Melastoma candidum]|uniref:Uncharacterized protein n=1 Tax=Melastoma candidum TaxID=119954 RepID=A0ACB9MZ67_9MYRT|nr:hypothetical protein MLD38_027875 [Melastoma candidum]
MGCVFGKDASPRRVERERSERNEGPVGEEVWAKVSNREVVDEVRNGCGNQRADDVGGAVRPRTERRRSSRPNPRLSNPPRNVHGEQVAASWPAWLSEVAGEAIRGWILQRADSFEKLDKIGQGTYSNVYKARDTLTGQIVALKKVRFDNLELESVKFMSPEILILRRLDHPNVVN